MLKNCLVLDKTALQLLQFRVALSCFRKHCLNLLAQSLDASGTTNTTNLLLNPADFCLEAQNFLLVNHKLFTEIFSQLRVLICYPAVGNLQLACDVCVLVGLARSRGSRGKAPLNDLKFAHFLFCNFILCF